MAPSSTLRSTLGVIREEALGRLRSWRVQLVVLVFYAWVLVPSVYDATRRIAHRNMQPEANRQAWALIRSYDIDAARWLHDCPRALVTGTIIDLNLAALVTLFLAYDSLVGQKSAGYRSSQALAVRSAPFVVGGWASVLIVWALATLVAHGIIGAVQTMAHGDFARTLSWAANTWLVVVAFAATWSALWVLISAWADTPKRALLAGGAITAALSLGRMALRTRFNYAPVPSMLDTGLLSGLPVARARAVATGAIWSSVSLFAAIATLNKRSERHPSAS